MTDLERLEQMEEAEQEFMLDAGRYHEAGVTLRTSMDMDERSQALVFRISGLQVCNKLLDLYNTHRAHLLGEVATDGSIHP